MNNNLRAAIGFGMFFGFVIAISTLHFDLGSIIWGIFLGLFMALIFNLLHLGVQIVQDERQIEITQAKIDVLEKLQNENPTHP